ncbi:hypothetical protein [Undibacterium sp. YM2]|uniref:hypothetical protein n=1 Tax=Undibacterium sp. YM2 TaxID=2058625 RepID=UPI001389B895|nr:hypothetical protein [Undibacterium sp. YM2]
MADAIAHVFLRIILSVLAASAAMAFVMLSGFFGGGGSGSSSGIFFACTLTLVLLGWSLLPAIRVSRILAALMIVAWICLGVACIFFGAPSVKGWLLAPWLLATLCNLALLKKDPPKYWAASEKINPQKIDETDPG